MLTLTTVIVVGVACLIVGAIFSTPIMRALADLKGDIRKEYQATIADLTADKAKAEAAPATPAVTVQLTPAEQAAALAPPVPAPSFIPPAPPATS